MLKNQMESYVRIGGRGLKNLTCPYMGIGGSKIAKIILTLLMNGPLLGSGFEPELSTLRPYVLTQENCLIQVRIYFMLLILLLMMKIIIIIININSSALSSCNTFEHKMTWHERVLNHVTSIL